MTNHALSQRRMRAGASRESLLVLGSVTLLSGLAVADRLAAWLVGEYPTYPVLWQLRFEFLRPIGAYYDMVAWHFGELSPGIFSALVLTAGALIAAGVVSRIRLARALSCHMLLAAAVVLSVFSSNPGQGVYAFRPFGMPSQPYMLIGIILSLIAAALCLRIHAEYVGWSVASSPTVRRVRYRAVLLRRNLGVSVTGLLEQLNPAPRRLRAAPAAARTTSRRDPIR
jgi:hypothetical protein